MSFLFLFPINFYASIGYLSRFKTLAVLGTYRIRDGLLLSEEPVDPFSVAHITEGTGAKLEVLIRSGFFRLNADHIFTEELTFSSGMQFGFR